jgi:hypothetical protein
LFESVWGAILAFWWLLVWHWSVITFLLLMRLFDGGLPCSVRVTGCDRGDRTADRTTSTVTLCQSVQAFFLILGRARTFRTTSCQLWYSSFSVYV